MKNYPEMVYEKALQYQQEGKYILGKSDDPSGKEHYIVYIDNKNIVVDDLVDSLRHYPLGNLKSFDFGLYNGDAAGNDSIDFGENESSLKCLVQADTATNKIFPEVNKAWAIARPHTVIGKRFFLSNSYKYSRSTTTQPSTCCALGCYRG